MNAQANNDQAAELKAKKARLDNELKLLEKAAHFLRGIESNLDSGTQDLPALMMVLAGRSLISDGIDAVMHHAREDDAIGLDDALGLADRALMAVASIACTIEIIEGNSDADALAELSVALKKFGAANA
jgi:hypothetical protein